MTFGEATRFLRKALGWTWESDEGKALAALERTFHAIRVENNALRRNNERLTARIEALEKSLREAKADTQRADAANRTAQTMAAHWRLKAEPTSADYDATKEGAP